MAIITSSDALKRLFAALTEHVFHVELGVADPPLVDYLSRLLERFVHINAIFKIRDILGRRLEQVGEMLLEAEQSPARPQREIHRHIGDFTLFWSGVYPELLKKLRAADNPDSLLEYGEQGKRSYYIASTYRDEDFAGEAPVLQRLSLDYDLCRYGLNCVRKEWEQLRLEMPH